MKGIKKPVLIAASAAVVAGVAYLLWPKTPAPAPAPAPDPTGPSDPIKPPREGVPTHRPSTGSNTGSTAGVGGTTNPPGPTAPGPTPTANLREMRRESYKGPAAYVPRGAAANGTEAPCSIGGLPYAAMADIARLNPSAAQTIANQIASQQLQLCIGQNYGGKLDPACASWLQMESQQMASFMADFGHLLPPPDPSAVMAPGDPNAVWSPCYDRVMGGNKRPTPGVASGGKLTTRSVLTLLGRDNATESL